MVEPLLYQKSKPLNTYSDTVVATFSHRVWVTSRMMQNSEHLQLSWMSDHCQFRSRVKVSLRPTGKGHELAWQGVWHENTKGTAAQLFRQRRRAGLKLGHVGEGQTYALRRCMLEGTKMRTIRLLCCTKRIRKSSPTRWLVMRRIQRSTFGIGVDLGSAGRNGAVQNRSWDEK